MRKVFAVAWLLLLGVTNLSRASTQLPEKLPDQLPGQCAKLSVAGSNHAPPLAYLHKPDNRPSGVAFDLLRYIAKQLTFSLDIRTQVPWGRAQSWVDSGELDILTGVYRTPEREAKWLFSAPFVQESAFVYISVTNPPSVESLEALAKYRGGKIQNSSYGPKLDQLSQRFKLFETISEQELFRMLDSHRLDFVFSAKWDADSVIKRLDLGDSIQPLIGSEDINSVHFVMKKGHPCAAFIQAANPLIEQAIKDGRIAHMLDKALHQSLEQDRAHH